MGHVKIETDQYPQAILRHISETSRNSEFFLLQNYPPAQQKPFFLNQRVKKKIPNAPNPFFYQSQVKAFGWFRFMAAQIWAITFVLNVLNYTNFLVIIMSPLLPAIETITH